MVEKVLGRMEVLKGFIQIPAKSRKELIGDIPVPSRTLLNGEIARLDSYGRLWSSFLQGKFPLGSQIQLTKTREGFRVELVATSGQEAFLNAQSKNAHVVGTLNVEKFRRKNLSKKATNLKIVKMSLGKDRIEKLVYPEDFINKVICGDCAKVMKQMPDEVIDLVVTSPPYDGLRIYEGYVFDFERIAQELYRVMKKGGVVVWVVGDKISNGNRSLTSFRQALYFQKLGFNVHDIMIYKKKNTPFMRANAYTGCFEFMFVFSKGAPKTFTPLMEKTKRSGYEMLVTNRKPDGIIKKVRGELKEMKVKTNIWEYAVGLGGTTRDKMAFAVPAVFPEKLAEDHVLSWSNESDIVLDPMCGSGTTCKMAKLHNRNYIGIDISEAYCDITQKRLMETTEQLTLKS